MSYDRISEDPDNFRGVFSRQLSLADDIRSRKVSAEDGSAEAKALFGATKSLEIDLHARMFEHKAARQALPFERSGDALPAPKADQ